VFPLNIPQKPSGTLIEDGTEDRPDGSWTYFTRDEDGQKFLRHRTAGGLDYWFELPVDDPTASSQDET